jgi:hypothetical protein
MILFFEQLLKVTIDVFLALLPLLILFVLFQFISLKIPIKQFMVIMRGLILAFIGLVLFIQGVNIGFINAGDLIGKTLGESNYSWVLIPIGFLLGFVVTFAEPAIQVLNIEVEKVSSGYINKKIMLYFLSFGVALAVSLSMIRMLNGISLWYFILPGYLIVLLLMWFVKPIFVAIAFDSGGVVTGPMIATFLLALTVGSSYAIKDSNPITDAFGMIAMVSMVPILSILILGLLYSREELKRKK